MKRPLDNEATIKGTVVCIPGASGKMSSIQLNFLNSLGVTVDNNSLKWNTRNVCAPRNFELVSLIIEKNQQQDGRQMVLWATSFGCRVVCEMMQRDLIDSRNIKIILAGYPLWGPKSEKRDRLETLLGIKAKFNPDHLLVISGEKDAFLAKNGPHELIKVAKEIGVVENNVILVTGGFHSVVDVPKKQRNGEWDRLSRAVLLLFLDSMPFQAISKGPLI